MPRPQHPPDGPSFSCFLQPWHCPLSLTASVSSTCLPTHPSSYPVNKFSYHHNSQNYFFAFHSSKTILDWILFPLQLQPYSTISHSAISNSSPAFPSADLLPWLVLPLSTPSRGSSSPQGLHPQEHLSGCPPSGASLEC